MSGAIASPLDVNAVRAAGFPLHSLTRDERQNELLKLLRYDITKVIRKDVIRQLMHGNSLAWHFHPYSWSVRCGDMRTPIEVYGDDDLLHDALEHRKTMGKCSSPSDLRKALSIYTGTQTVSNFSPLGSAALFDRYLPQGGVVYDPCAGWGGRLLGSIACKKVARYIATEPATLTFDGLCAMRDELPPMVRHLGRHVPEIELYKTGSEDFRRLEKGSIQMSIISSPYFDHEQYSHEETQSFIKFRTPEAWRDEWLGATLSNCHHALTETGCLAVNIAGVPSYPHLTEHLFWIAGRCGFRPVETLRLTLSAMPSARGAFKHEPVFIFRKG
jgi:hypothetical protein